MSPQNGRRGNCAKNIPTADLGSMDRKTRQNTIYSRNRVQFVVFMNGPGSFWNFPRIRHVKLQSYFKEAINKKQK